MGYGLIRADAAVAEGDDARAVLGDVGLVRHQHNRQPALVVEALEDAHHLDARARVEIARWLVGEEKLRVIHQRAGDGDALLLASGELIRMVPEPLAQADRAQCFCRSLSTLLCVARAGIEQRQLHVFNARSCAAAD